MRKSTCKYFYDSDRGTVELTSAHAMRNTDFAIYWPDVAGLRYDSFHKWVGMPVTGREQGPFPITRIIAYKAAPSRHECNAKCVGGNPRGTCECKCGGSNHGRA